MPPLLTIPPALHTSRQFRKPQLSPVPRSAGRGFFMRTGLTLFPHHAGARPTGARARDGALWRPKAFCRKTLCRPTRARPSLRLIFCRKRSGPRRSNRRRLVSKRPHASARLTNLRARAFNRRYLGFHRRKADPRGDKGFPREKKNPSLTPPSGWRPPFRPSF